MLVRTGWPKPHRYCPVVHGDLLECTPRAGKQCRELLWHMYVDVLRGQTSAECSPEGSPAGHLLVRVRRAVRC
jgi:hypothetical protein